MEFHLSRYRPEIGVDESDSLRCCGRSTHRFGRLLLLPSQKSNIHTLRRLQHDIRPHHRKLIHPALDALERLQYPHDRVRHLRQSEFCRYVNEQ